MAALGTNPRLMIIQSLVLPSAPRRPPAATNGELDTKPAFRWVFAGNDRQHLTASRVPKRFSCLLPRFQWERIHRPHEQCSHHLRTQPAWWGRGNHQKKGKRARAQSDLGQLGISVDVVELKDYGFASFCVHGARKPLMFVILGFSAVRLCGRSAFETIRGRSGQPAEGTADSGRTRRQHGAYAKSGTHTKLSQVFRFSSWRGSRRAVRYVHIQEAGKGALRVPSARQHPWHTVQNAAGSLTQGRHRTSLSNQLSNGGIYDIRMPGTVVADSR